MIRHRLPRFDAIARLSTDTLSLRQSFYLMTHATMTPYSDDDFDAITSMSRLFPSAASVRRYAVPPSRIYALRAYEASQQPLRDWLYVPDLGL